MRHGLSCVFIEGQTAAQGVELRGELGKYANFISLDAVLLNTCHLTLP